MSKAKRAQISSCASWCEMRDGSSFVTAGRKTGLTGRISVWVWKARLPREALRWCDAVHRGRDRALEARHDTEGIPFDYTYSPGGLVS